MCLVARGFTQLSGEYFTDSFAPVVNDITMRILLVMWILHDLKGIQLDIHTAFLYGDLDEEVYIETPEGYDLRDDECLKL